MYKRVLAALAVAMLSATSPLAKDLGIMDATWYGIGDGSGSHTASGMRFNANNPHIVSYYKKAFPWGTRLLITNVDNGKSLCVSVQDYGPAKWTHVEVDVTHAGAKKLGFSGKAQVRVERVNCHIPDGFIPDKFDRQS